MSDNRVAESVDIVARHVVAHGTEYLTGDGWDIYPEIGEDDWLAVVKRAEQIAPYPDRDEYEAAYTFLEARAAKDV